MVVDTSIYTKKEVVAEKPLNQFLSEIHQEGEHLAKPGTFEVPQQTPAVSSDIGRTVGVFF